MRVNPNGNPDIRQQILSKFDQDGDGKLNEQEKAAAKEARAQRGGRPAGPGVPGGPQGKQPPQEIIDRFDTDGDGAISEEERAAAREAMAQQGGPPGGRGGIGGPKGTPPQEILDRFDTDGDGTISEEERAAAREARPQPSGGTRGLGQGGGIGRRAGAGAPESGQGLPFMADLQGLGSLARSINEGSEPEVPEVQSAYDNTGTLTEQIQESEIPDTGKERLLSRVSSLRTVFADYLQSRLGSNFVV